MYAGARRALFSPRLGPNLVINGDFTDWTGVAPNDTPDGWTVIAEDANNFVTEVPGGASFVSDGSATLRLDSDTSFVVGKTYDITVVVPTFTSGIVDLRNGTSAPNILSLNAAATFTISDYLATSSSPITFRRRAACDMVIGSITVQQVL